MRKISRDISMRTSRPTAELAAEAILETNSRTGQIRDDQPLRGTTTSRRRPTASRNNPHATAAEPAKAIASVDIPVNGRAAWAATTAAVVEEVTWMPATSTGTESKVPVVGVDPWVVVLDAWVVVLEA
jgi:hypothetical protein